MDGVKHTLWTTNYSFCFDWLGDLGPIYTTRLWHTIFRNSVEPSGRIATLVNESRAGIVHMRQHYILQGEKSYAIVFVNEPLVV